MKKLIYVLALFVGIIFTITSYASENETMAPNFMLNKLDGGTFTLSDYKGKVVFIFFMGYGCPYCIDAATGKVKTEIINTYSASGSFVSVAIDTWQGNSTQVNNFKATTGLNTLYCLEGHTIVGSYNLNNSYDRLVVVDKYGNIEHKGTMQASNDIVNAKAAIDAALAEPYVVTSLNEQELISLKQNYPNPFSESTVISYSVKKTANVTLSVLDITGRNIATLVDETKPKGEYEVVFSGQSLSKGIYFYKIQANEQISMGKMIVE